MYDEVNWVDGRAGDRVPSVLAIYASLLVAAGAFGVILTILFGSFVLFAILIDLRVVLTVALGAVVALFVERAMLFQLTAWRPPLQRLLVSGLPAAPVALAISAWLPWSLWLAIPTAVAAGLLVQALMLSYLS
jgi:hypothetical protein